MRKILFFCTFLLGMLLTIPILGASNFNLELTSTIANEKMISGEQNYLNVKLKSTGAKTTFNDVELIVSSDNKSLINYDEDSLKKLIDEKFDSYQIKDGVLHIKATKLDSGRYYDLPIKFTSENGMTPNGTEITFNVEFKSKELNVKAADSATTTIEATSPLKINKKLLGFEPTDIESKMMYFGQDTYWMSRAAIDAKDKGQEFIKEGTKIKIVEKYDANLVYEDMEDGPIPTVDTVNRTLTWEFDAPSYEEQKQAKGSLWNQELIVKYGTVEEPENNTSKVDINVSTELSFIDITGNNNDDKDEITVALYPGPAEIPQLNGVWNVFGHWGPADGKGNHGYANREDMQLNPVVYENDKVSFAHRLSSMYSGRLKGYDKFFFNYMMDDYLDLQTLRVPSQWTNFPDNTNGTNPISRMPEYKIYLLNKKVTLDIDETNELVDDDIIAVLESGKDFNHGDTIDIKQVLKDQGIDSNTHIAQIRYDFRDTPPGMFSPTGTNGSNMFKYEFRIDPDWKNSPDYDSANNKLKLSNDIAIFDMPKKPSLVDDNIVAEIWDMTSDKINSQNSWWINSNNILVSKMYTVKHQNGESRFDGFQQSKWWEVNGPRIAFVTDNPEKYEPTVTNTIELSDNTKGEINIGDNILKVKVHNHMDSSVGSISEGGFYSYIMIPNNIELDLSSKITQDKDGNPITSDITKVSNFENSLYSLYKIHWYPNSTSVVLPGSELNLLIDVQVKSGLADLKMHVFTDLPNDRAFKTLEIIGDPKITDTTIVNDELDITGSGTDWKILKSSNAYRLIDYYYLVTKKLVKGSLDNEYSSSGKMSLDGVTSYKLQIKNKEDRIIDSFTLLDVLPSIKDQGITDGVARGSEFGLTLNGPIKVDDKFNIEYSKSKNPKRDDLNAQLKVDGFDEITNPDDSEDPAWLTASEVSNWNEIHSFKITLKDNETLQQNEVFEFTFDTVVDPVDKSSISKDKTYKAWNSFAITINGSPTVEPLQIPVVIEKNDSDKPDESGTSDKSDKSKDLPKTGYDLSLPIILMLIGLSGIGIRQFIKE